MAAQTRFRATPLREEDFEKGRIHAFRTDPFLKYRWAAGVAIGRFLEGLQQGKILGSHCHECGRTVVPPRAFCELCFVPVGAPVELPQTGTINTFAVSWIATDRSRLKKPVVPAVVDIDGTSNAGLLHLVGNTDAKKVKIGMRVKAVWKPAKERRGDITDILHFEPIAGGRA